MKMPTLSLGALLIFGTASNAEKIDFYIGSTANGGKGGIYLSTLDEDSGSITAPKQILTLEGAGFQALSPDGSSLLSTSSTSQTKGGTTGQITLFSIGVDRKLTQTGQTSTLGNGTCHVSFDQTGKIAMFANYGSGNVGSALIGEGGSLGALASDIKFEGKSINPDRQEKPHAHSIYPDPENHYAYACDLGTDTVNIFKIDTATGKLTPVGKAKTELGAGPRHLKFSKDGTRIYVLNELNATISVFERLKGGQLKRLQDVSTQIDGAVPVGMTCSEIRVHPNGKFVYAANRDTTGNGNDTISALKVLDDGSLLLLSAVPAEGSIPRNINLSPSGKWLITGGQKSNDLAIFSVDPNTGSLNKSGDNIVCPSPMCYVFLK
jgi:6-phosphogluconolactonase